MRLRTSRNAERQERAACLTEQFPPASRQRVPTDMGGATAAEPQASGGAAEQTPETPDGGTNEQQYGFTGGR